MFVCNARVGFQFRYVHLIKSVLHFEGTMGIMEERKAIAFSPKRHLLTFQRCIFLKDTVNKARG